MGRREPTGVGEYYHIYNRGVDKRVIFNNKFEYLRFIALLYICNGKKDVDIYSFLKKKEGPTFFTIFDEDRGEMLVSIGAYCLMPNHFHILVREESDKGISLFMKKLSTAYAMFFNNINSRKGTLFEGRYKAKHVAFDEYLKYLYAYIHLNPVKIVDPLWKQNGISDVKKAQEFLDVYDHSSFQVYKGGNTFQRNILNTSAFPEYFEHSADFDTMINYYMTYSK